MLSEKLEGLANHMRDALASGDALGATYIGRLAAELDDCAQQAHAMESVTVPESEREQEGGQVINLSRFLSRRSVVQGGGPDGSDAA